MTVPTIGLIGLGKMGQTYLRLLDTSAGVPPEKIVVWDQKPQVLEELEAKDPRIMIASSLEDCARRGQAFIIATNTPGHAPVIGGLAEHGAKRILLEPGFAESSPDKITVLSEKPITDTVVSLDLVRRVAKRNKSLEIFTAMVILWSPVRPIIEKLMRDHDLELRRASAQWGKNRADKKETRPTPGDRDEWIHPAEVALSCVENLNFVKVRALLDYLEFANAEAQAEAHRLDPSFPLRPESAIQAIIEAYPYEGPRAIVNVESSFDKPEQIRRVEMTFAKRGSNKAEYAVVAYFDEKDPDDEKKLVDRVVITELLTNEKTGHIGRGNKLGMLTAAFVAAAQGERPDRRLLSLDESGFYIELMQALELSAARGSQEHVFLGRRPWYNKMLYRYRLTA